ncbi:LuxR C-terminal-related transcriptional regulator [Mycolicibacterium hippocampi]|uniref:helix-turn-helix transcriptional regulator n=1 Tax=Mycolicibacterium hippocampi TaxID=659824 RepID=UPI003514DBE2
MLGAAEKVARARSVGKFLGLARVQPSALFIDGEAGIGKTTLWLETIQRARESGFAVLSAQGAPTESVLAYGGLADLVSNVDVEVWAGLSEPQRAAMLGAVDHREIVGGVDDARAVSAGFLTLVHGLAARAPVLIAVDDIPWIDRSTRDVLAFVARRIDRPVGLLVTERLRPDVASASTWLRMLRPESSQNLTLGPLSLGKLHSVLSGRLGRSFPRPTMARIAEISGGNPFYALELGRALLRDPRGTDVALPGTLAELVSARVGSLPEEVLTCLLAVACAGTVSTTTVAQAIDRDAAETHDLLSRAEDDGIVGFDGHRVRFAHPLLAQGVYAGATPSARRTMHRRLADVIDEPELKARHLALGATAADPETLEKLDDAARSASARGAPAAAAELLDIAVRHDPDSTPQRRIRAARHHLAAGDPRAARALLESVVEALPNGSLRSKALAQLAAVHLFDNHFLEAAALLERALAEAGEDPARRAQILTALAFAVFNGGHVEASIAYIEQAEAFSERAGLPLLSCQALTMRIHFRFMRGDGLDEAALQRAMLLESEAGHVPAPFRPSLHRACLLSWTGRLAEGRDELLAIRRRCIERGEESEMLPVTFNSFLVELWLGNIDAAQAVAADAMERAEQLGGALAPGIAHTMHAALAAYAGNEEAARGFAEEAIATSRRSGAMTLLVWPISILGFLEVSLHNHEAAIATLEPALDVLDTMPESTEIITAPFVADAAEALVEAGRWERAESLIERLERNGARLGRTWLLAVSARCRGMLHAANGDLAAATRSTEEALKAHEQLPMPFERARSELLLGKLQRRRRHREAATDSLRRSLKVFDEYGAPLWAERARAELARTDVTSGGPAVLTASEQRVAELAAAGRTNRDIAAALFISPKTVEANLGRAYRKLGIRSRSQLARHVDPRDP